MLFPENPENQPSLWDGLASQLAETSICYLIEDGIGNPLAEAKGPDGRWAECTLARLRAAQICRISANHGNPIAPHFAGIREGDNVFVTEFLTYPSDRTLTVDSEKLKRDLEAAVINLLFAKGGASSVNVPLHIAPWSMQDAEISQVQEGLLFRKKI
jgi:hypothetical protein